MAIPVTPPEGADENPIVGLWRYPPPLSVICTNLIPPVDIILVSAAAVDPVPTRVNV